jgi:hypothetical protein
VVHSWIIEILRCFTRMPWFDSLAVALGNQDGGGTEAYEIMIV